MPSIDHSASPSVSEAAVKKATWKNWSQWFRILDRFPKDRSHTERAAWLRLTHLKKDWWSQMVTVQYEYARRLRSRTVVVPKDLKGALAKHRRAAAAFETMPPSHRREYVEYVTEAKRSETRKKRIAKSLKMMVEWYDYRKKSTK